MPPMDPYSDPSMMPPPPGLPPELMAAAGPPPLEAPMDPMMAGGGGMMPPPPMPADMGMPMGMPMGPMGDAGGAGGDPLMDAALAGSDVLPQDLPSRAPKFTEFVPVKGEIKSHDDCPCGGTAYKRGDTKFCFISDSPDMTEPGKGAKILDEAGGVLGEEAMGKPKANGSKM